MSKVEGRGPIDPPLPLMPSCNFFSLMPSRVDRVLNFTFLELGVSVNIHNMQSGNPELALIHFRATKLDL